METETLPQRSRTDDLDEVDISESADDQPTSFEDIDPAAWLSKVAEEEVETDFFLLGGNRRLKIAALTDDEERTISRNSRRLDKKLHQIKLDFTQYKRNLVAFSLNKANPGKPPILGDQLGSIAVGDLTRLMQAIMVLSGMEVNQQAQSQGIDNLFI